MIVQLQIWGAAHHTGPAHVRVAAKKEKYEETFWLRWEGNEYVAVRQSKRDSGCLFVAFDDKHISMLNWNKYSDSGDAWKLTQLKEIGFLALQMNNETRTK